MFLPVETGSITAFLGEKMKRVLGAAALFAALPAAAWADDSVTVNGLTFYGTIDVGAAYQTHGAPINGYFSPTLLYVDSKASNRAQFTVAPNAMGNSRLGLKGAEELGGGWIGLFKLETGFDPASGNLSDSVRSIQQQNGVPLAQQSSNGDSSRAGQAFNQAAYVGASHPLWGTLTMGRQVTLQGDAINAYDPQYGSYAFSPIGYSGMAGGSGQTQDFRWDNSAKYLGSYGPARLGLMYAFGGTLTRNDTGVAVDVGFDYAGLSMDGVYTHKKDEFGAAALSSAQMLQAPSGAITGTVSDNDSYSVAAKYDWQAFKFYVGYEYIVWANPSSPLATGAVDIGGYYIFSPNNNAYAIHKTVDIAWGGLRYAATPKLDLAAAAYHYGQNSYKGNGCSNTSAASCSGDLYAFSLTALYHLTKRFESYAGLMYSQNLDGLASGFLHNNSIDPTIGFRYVF